MNFLTGLLIVLILYAGRRARVPTIGGFMEGYGTENCGLRPGTGSCPWTATHLVYSNAVLLPEPGGETVDFVVERDGERWS